PNVTQLLARKQMGIFPKKLNTFFTITKIPRLGDMFKFSNQPPSAQQLAIVNIFMHVYVHKHVQPCTF
ncbi:hypothetical protein P7M41_26675, partial [Vibrio parahaemolyticus]|nr:hypothetical protein [Vibrio parahaemolyticus]